MRSKTSPADWRYNAVLPPQSSKNPGHRSNRRLPEHRTEDECGKHRSAIRGIARPHLPLDDVHSPTNHRASAENDLPSIVPPGPTPDLQPENDPAEALECREIPYSEKAESRIGISGPLRQDRSPLKRGCRLESPLFRRQREAYSQRAYRKAAALPGDPAPAEGAAAPCPRWQSPTARSSSRSTANHIPRRDEV